MSVINSNGWTTKHIITTFIVGLFLTLLAAGIMTSCTHAMDQDRKKAAQKQEAVEQCIREATRSASDCRLAIYGYVGR